MGAEQPAPPKTWARRMAEFLHGRSELSVDDYETALDMAGELKCVRLKILLARCWEMMSESESADAKVNVGDGFLDEVFAEFRR